jgi:hypothetical protein
MTPPRKDCAADGECYPTLKSLDHPLQKIFGDIPAGSSLPAVGRGFHPRFSEALQKNLFYTCFLKVFLYNF